MPLTKLDVAKNIAAEEVKKYVASASPGSNVPQKPFKFSDETSAALTEAFNDHRKMTDPAITTTINWGQFLTNLESTVTFLVNAGTQVLPFIIQIIALLPKTPTAKPFGVPLTPEDHHPVNVSPVKVEPEKSESVKPKAATSK